MKFDEITPEVEVILADVRAGRTVDDGSEAVRRVLRALNAYNETMTSNTRTVDGTPDVPVKGLLPHFCQPGPQSALFARLLAGDAPLSFPPPTSFSYPWYALIEEPGPHVLSSVSRAAMLAANHQSDGIGQYIHLDHCTWDIVSANAAAKELLEIDQCFSTRATEAEPALAPFWESILAAYAKQPEFIVRYGQWTFRMRVGRFRTTARRDHAKTAIAAGGRINSIYGPLDLSALDLNARMGETVWHFDLPAHCAQNRRQEAPNQESSGEGGHIEVLLVDPDTQQAIQEYLADPAAYDFVAFEVDAWVLEMEPAS